MGRQKRWVREHVGCFLAFALGHYINFWARNTSLFFMMKIKRVEQYGCFVGGLDGACSSWCRSGAVEKGKREESTRCRGGLRTARARILAFFVSNCVTPMGVGTRRKYVYVKTYTYFLARLEKTTTAEGICLWGWFALVEGSVSAALDRQIEKRFALMDSVV